MTRGDVLRYNLAYALIRASKIVRGLRQALTERERYAVADHVVAQLKEHGDPWHLSEKRAHRWGRLRDNDANLERRGLRLLDKQLAPAARTDFALRLCRRSAVGRACSRRSAGRPSACPDIWRPAG
jgi:hypothetical protein